MILCTVSVCQSCDKEFTNNVSNDIVVEGWIDAGGYPVVILTRECPVRLKADRISIKDLSDYVVQWAFVTVSDGNKSAVLIGRIDNRYFPGYIYTTDRIKGEAGKSYTLTVKYLDKEITSTTTIPLYPPAVDSLVCSRVPGGKGLCNITAYVTNVPGRSEYYKSAFMEGTGQAQYLSSFLGVVDDALADSVMSMPIIRTIKDNDKENRTRYFHEDTLVSVKVATIDRESYDFWKSYANKSDLNNFMLSSTIGNLPTNIKGGLGYWSGYNPFIYTFTVKPGTYPGNRDNQ